MNTPEQLKNDAEQNIRRIRVAPNTVAYVENHKLVMEFAIPGAPTATIDVKSKPRAVAVDASKPMWHARFMAAEARGSAG